MDRFYHPESLAADQVMLTDGEAQHLVRTLRKQPGDAVELFDGRGQRVSAEVLTVGKREATLQVIERPNVEPSPATRLVIATPLPKGERSRWLVEKATELGVDELIPLTTSRSVVDPRESKLDKLRQTVIAACKQCRRDWLMQIHPTTSWDDLLHGLADDDLTLLADPAADVPLWQSLSSQPAPLARTMILFGPEGGLTDDEAASARAAGAEAVCLGPRILRIETAVLAAACIHKTR